MGEIRMVGPGKTRGYPYPVCKKILSLKLRILRVRTQRPMENALLLVKIWRVRALRSGETASFQIKKSGGL